MADPALSAYRDHDPSAPEWGWLRDYQTWEPIREATREEWQRSAQCTGWGAYDDGERVVVVTGGPPLSVYTIVTQIWAEVDWIDHGPARRAIHDKDSANDVGCREAQRAAVEMASWAPLTPWRVLVWIGGRGEGSADAVWVNSSAVTIDDARRIMAGVDRDHEYAAWAADEYMEVVNRILSEERAKNMAAAIDEANASMFYRVAVDMAAERGIDTDIAEG